VEARAEVSGDVIDLHCHVVAGIDDGPRRLEQSLAMARAALSGGTRMMVATPHVSWTYHNRSEPIEAGVAELNRALAGEGIGLEVRTGAEIDASYSSELAEAELGAMRLGGGDALLIECPLTVAAAPLDAIVFGLQRRGHRVVLAHPERSAVIRAQPGRMEAMIRAGAVTSITAGSLLGQFGREVRRFSFWMLEEGLVHNVASDAHDTVRRPPGLRDALMAAAALEAPGLAHHVDWLAHDVPRALLDCAPLPPAPAAPIRVARGPIRRLADRMSARRG
jgi:protein-tyrosine phosphatase